MEKERNFLFLFSSDAENSDHAVSLITTEQDLFSEGCLYWNGECQDKDIYFSVNGTSGFLVSLYYLFCIIVCIWCGFTLFLLFEKRINSRKNFLDIRYNYGDIFYNLFSPIYSTR